MSQASKVPPSEAEPWLALLPLARELPYELAELASKAAALQASKALKQAETNKLRGWREWCSTHTAATVEPLYLHAPSLPSLGSPAP
eukprot:8851247-Pyramimonas_sp.AAC.1